MMSFIYIENLSQRRGRLQTLNLFPQRVTRDQHFGGLLFFCRCHIPHYHDNIRCDSFN